MFSEGIAGKLGEQFAVELAHSDAQIAASLQRTQFDLILLDIDLGESRNALDMMDLLRASGIPVLVLSNRATVADKRALARLGAQGFVTKQTTLADLATAIKMVLAGHTFFPQDFMRSITAKNAHELPHMSGQQTVVLNHLVREPGRHTEAIAREMGVSTDWVQTLVSQLCNSYRVRNRAELIDDARKRGFVPQRAQFEVA